MHERHGLARSPVYLSWVGMVQRCTNPKATGYENYGGRGIKVCERWKDSFVNFFEDMGDRPEGMTLDRIDNNGNYEPGNCRWATGKEQKRNSRAAVRLTYKGQEKTIIEWSEVVGLSRFIIRKRIAAGWSAEAALTRGSHKGKPMSTGVDSPLKWHGGKSYLANKIISLMPPRCKNPNNPDPDDPGYIAYVEPYAGGLSVLLANDPVGISEVANDLNGPLTNFWDVMADPVKFEIFNRRMQATPFSEVEWQRAAERSAFEGDPIEEAAGFFIHCRQSLSGRMKGFAGISRTRTRQGQNEQVAAWLSAVEGLPAVHARLKRVLIRNIDGVECIKKEDGKRTLHYVDCPYVHSTRATTGEYAHEMTDVQHAELLNTLMDIEGRFLLSGYHSELYDKYAKNCGWKVHEFQIANHSSSSKQKQRKCEVVWTNY